VTVVPGPVDSGGGDGAAHELVEAGSVHGGADGRAALCVGGIDEAGEAFRGLGGGRLGPVLLSMMDEFGLQGWGGVLGDALTHLVASTRAPSSWRENQTTRSLAPIAARAEGSVKWRLAVPDGPGTTTFSRHSARSKEYDSRWGRVLDRSCRLPPVEGLRAGRRASCAPGLGGWGFAPVVLGEDQDSQPLVGPSAIPSR
jgi:hypothetical protein